MARMLKPTAVTLDIALPDMSGWDVLRELKRDPGTRHIPVVIISMMGNRELGLTLGAADYFTKPLDREVFVTRLAELAPRSGEGSARILLVDDDPDVHELLGEELGRLGYVVEHALSGQQGLERARNGQRPDAVVLDLMMPDLTGFEVADALRAHEPTAHVPIVVLTAKDLSPEDRQRLQGKIAALVQKGQAIPPRLVAAIRELEAGKQREVPRAR
jgi:CheY-like chemotaxis protein